MPKPLDLPERPDGPDITKPPERPDGSEITRPHERPHGPESTKPPERPDGSEITRPHERPHGFDPSNPIEGPFLLPGERLDDLQYKGLMLIQSENAFRFGTDSVLLAGFARPRRTDECIDLGAGSGVLSVLLNGRVGCRVTAVERDATQCDRLRRSIVLNHRNGAGAESESGRRGERSAPDEREHPCTQGIRVVCADYIEDVRSLGLGHYDCAVCNPPYFRGGSGGSPTHGEATHELTADIGRVSRAAGALLKFGGRLYICFPAFRLSEALCALNAAGLEPKRLRLVSSLADRPPYLALIETKKGAKHGIIVEKPLIIHTETGEYTDEVREIYHV